MLLFGCIIIFSSSCAKCILGVFRTPKQCRVRPDARRVWQRSREGHWAAAVFGVAIAIPVEVGLHLGLYPILHFSAHVTVPVLLLGCLFVSRAVRLSVMWTPLPWCAPGVNNRIHSLCN